MKVKSIYINLPVKDIQKTREFWTSLGFTFNDKYSNSQALCLELNERTINAMLITREYFETFTNRPVSDGTTTQVLIAIEVESREKVDELLKSAVENGGSKYREATDLGWMYYESFADPDGHQWEVMFTDPTQYTNP